MKTLVAELKVSVLREGSENPSIFDEPQKILEMWESVEKSSWYDPDKECLIVFALDCRNQVKGFFLISLGSNNQTICEPRDIFRPLIAASSNYFVMAHNHPSGDPSPSSADLKMTRRIVECGDLMQIKLLDHCIVGNGKYFSFREGGMV